MQTALILPTKWSAPPSVSIPRRANGLKRAKQPSGTANASNTRQFMVTSPATPPVPNSTTAHQLNNAVQKICSVSAFGAHAPALGRPRAAKCLPVTLRLPTTSIQDNSGPSQGLRLRVLAQSNLSRRRRFKPETAFNQGEQIMVACEKPLNRLEILAIISMCGLLLIVAFRDGNLLWAIPAMTLFSLTGMALLCALLFKPDEASAFAVT